MKVLLIRPPYARLKGTGPSPYFPLGLGYITSVLRDNGFEAMIYHAENPRSGREILLVDPDVNFDLRSIGYRKYQEALADDGHYVWREVAETIRDYKPDIVGLSLLSVEVGSALKISRITKNYHEDCPVVWGGVHPTFLPDDCLKNEAVDFVIRGEGEYSMLELCQTLAGGSPLEGIAGLSFKKGGQIVHNPKRELIADIDAIPSPAWDHVLYPETFNLRSLGSLILSRGCPYRCTFCVSRNFWDKRVRFRSPERVIEEIKTLVTRYGTSYFMLWDDSFTFNRKIIDKYCKAMIDNRLGIIWKTSTRADLIDEETLKLMKRSGCTKLEIGVESGSDKMKRIIHKDVTNKQIKAAFELINKNGIGSGAFFMAGFPEETMEDLEETFQLMKELKANEIFFNVFDPMPGSAEYEKCLQFGLVPENPDWNSFPFWPDAHYVRDISREDFDAKIQEMARWLYHKNASFTSRFKRNRQLVLSLLKHHPHLLVKKTYGFLKRRWQSSRAAGMKED